MVCIIARQNVAVTHLPIFESYFAELLHVMLAVVSMIFPPLRFRWHSLSFAIHFQSLWLRKRLQVGVSFRPGLTTEQ